MKLIKSLAIVGVITALFASCTEEYKPYQPAEPETGSQFYFDSNAKGTITLTLATTAIELDVLRYDASEAATAVISVKDTSKVIIAAVDSTINVSFAAEEKAAKLSIPVKMDKINYGDQISLVAKITSDATLYGVSEFSFTAILPEPWSLMGTGTLVDDIACGLYGITPIAVPCTVYKNDAIAGMYRIEDFQLPLVSAIFEQDMTAAEGSNWRKAPLLIDATNPDDVRIELQDYGVCLNSGDGWIDGVTSIYKGAPFSVGTLVDGVISFPTAKGMLCTLNGNGYYYADQHGKFAVALPGAVIADYSVDVAYSGLMTDKDGDDFAVVEATLGADVAEAAIAIAAGSDPNAALALILTPSEEENESVITVSAGGEYRLPIPEDLDEEYSVVIVSFSADGEAQELAYDVFEYKDFGIKVVASQPEANIDGVSGTVQATVTLGKDVEYALVAMAGTADDALAVIEAYDPAAAAPAAILIKENSVLDFVLPAEGNYSIVAVSYAVGEAWNASAANIEFVLVSPWNALGYVQYTDDVIGPLFSASPVTYWVPIEEHKETAGLYRLIYPYGECYPYNEAGDWDDSKDYNMLVDASDPTAVTIAEQDLGVNWGYGIMGIGTIQPGTLADGKITFPEKGLYTYDDDGSYYANRNSAFLIDLNTLTDAVPDAVQKRSTNKAQRFLEVVRQKTFVSVAHGKGVAGSLNKQLGTPERAF